MVFVFLTKPNKVVIELPIYSQLITSTGKTTWGFQLALEVAHSLVELSFHPVGTEAISRYIASKWNWTEGHPTCVCCRINACLLQEELPTHSVIEVFCVNYCVRTKNCTLNLSEFLPWQECKIKVQFDFFACRYPGWKDCLFSIVPSCCFCLKFVDYI